MAEHDDRAEAVEAFAQVATPDEKAKVAVVEDSVLSAVTAAQAIEVRTAAEAQHATDVLARIKREVTQAEEARRFLVKPLNDHVRAINDRFRGPREALEAADGIIREKIIAFRQEQERRRAEEQARLEREAAERRRQAEEEQRRREAEARAAREKAAREAAAAEAAARRQEQERARQRDEATAQRRRELEELTDDALRYVLTQEPDEQDAALAAAILADRRATREAQERAAAAARAEEEARALEEATRAQPVPDVVETVVAPQGVTRGDAGASHGTKRWTFTVEDESRVPRSFLKVDEQAIRAAVRAGERTIPGVRIFQQDGLAVRGS